MRMPKPRTRAAAINEMGMPLVSGRTFTVTRYHAPAEARHISSDSHLPKCLEVWNCRKFGSQ
jgi:hypothetical protein